MKTAQFAVLIASLVLGFSARAADVCAVCHDIDGLLQRMDKVVPDPTNTETLDKQDELSGEALKIVKANLTDKNLTPANVKAIVKLIVRTLPYDIPGDFTQLNMRAFQHQYNKPQSLLKPAIDQMQSSGEISADQKNQLIEYFNVNGKNAKH